MVISGTMLIANDMAQFGSNRLWTVRGERRSYWSGGQ